MRFLPLLAYGTSGYPEKVARRLRVVNVISWFGAALVGQFALRRLLDPADGRLEMGFVAIGVATCFACIPLLHRFGAWAATFALTMLVYIDGVRVTWQGGTGGGYWLGFFAASALVVLLLGAERYLLSGFLVAVAGGLLVVLHLTVPFDTGELPPDKLRAAFFTNLVFYMILIFATVLYAAWQIERAETLADKERERSDMLLANMLPASVAERLKQAPDQIVADRYDDASILVADLEGFTARAGAIAPDDLVRFLDRVFSTFDRLVEKHGVEKIKTSGDAYLVVSGVPDRRPDHAERLAAFALDMRDAAARFGGLGEAVPIRIGLACGPVVAGVVGQKRFFYDVWGDAVNVAARMESTGQPGQIQVSAAACDRLAEHFVLEPRGAVDIKGKGVMETWLLIARQAPAEMSASQRSDPSGGAPAN